MINRYERLNQELKMVETKRKVAAYCRVSTDNEDQANSFESQQRYFRQYIERNPDWELYEIFADEGISGTNTKKRKEFNRMIACAKNGDFDLIITKEISRFARNTLDSIYYTRELKKHGVGVIFMNDNINTLDGDAELRLAIMSSIAQEESRKTSERVKWGQKRQMEQGVVFGRSMLGYDVEGGKMTINEEGARVVRLIFHKFVNEGKGTHVIARELREEGISPMRVKEWSNTVILRVIRNEKYCGDLVQKKTYTPDFLSHEKKYNRGQEEFVIIKDHHEPIISRELFDEANRILDAKSLSQEGKAKHSNRYPFSGKIKCGCCGSSYVARYKTRKDGSRYKAWRCNEAAKHGSPHIDKAGNQVGCTGLSIRNEDATHIMYLVTKNLKYNRDKIINNLTAVIQSIIAMDTTGTDVLKLQEQIKKIEGKRANLIDLYMSNLINKDEFTATRASCDAEIEELQSIIESVDKQREMIEQQQQLLKEIEDAIKEIVSGVEYEDEFYKHILDKMVVQDKDNIDVYLNLLPMKWSYTVAKASKKAVASEWNISEASLPMGLITLFMESGVVLVMILGTYLLSIGQIEPPRLILAIVLGGLFTSSITKVATFQHYGIVFKQAMKGIWSILGVSAPNRPEHSDAPVNGEIVISDLSFAYNGDGKVLENINLRFPKGSKTALVGASGCGKSTLANLLMGFWEPTDGHITIAGEDAATFSEKQLNRLFSIVQQEVFLFNLSMEENIRIGKPEACMEEIIAAAKKARIHDFIMSLPNGYQTTAGEAGVKFSGGEKQRISIARMILKDAPIIILDEATAAVDTENEAYIQAAIDDLSRDKTVIMIAHHLNTIRDADQIVVMDSGRVIDTGKHNPLLGRCALYRKMVENQNKVDNWKIKEVSL